MTQFTDSGLANGGVYEYRVIALRNASQSPPSEIVRTVVGPDFDQDGVPDSVEGGGSSSTDTDRDEVPDYQDDDSDNDGVSDTEERILGTNSAAADTDGDGFNDLADLFPHDPRRSKNVPFRRYMSVDFTTPHIGQRAVFDVAIDNVGRLGFGWKNDNTFVGSRINPNRVYQQFASVPFEQQMGNSSRTYYVSCVNSLGWLGGNASDPGTLTSQGRTWALVANPGIVDVTPQGPDYLAPQWTASTTALTNDGTPWGG